MSCGLTRCAHPHYLDTWVTPGSHLTPPFPSLQPSVHLHDPIFMLLAFFFLEAFQKVFQPRKTSSPSSCASQQGLMLPRPPKLSRLHSSFLRVKIMKKKKRKDFWPQSGRKPFLQFPSCSSERTASRTKRYHSQKKVRRTV